MRLDAPRITFWRRMSPATRVATGLVSLMLSLLLIADLFLGFLPDRTADARRHHALSSALIATQLAAGLRDARDDRGDALQALLATAAGHDPQLLSAALVSASGQMLAQIGAHASAWTLGDGERSSADQLRTTITLDHRPWGELQLVFRPARARTPAGWLRDPLLQGLALLGLLGFVSFQLYLRRVLRYLDPNAAVPERVRTAFDTLTEGVLVLDTEGHVLLANKAFCSLQPAGAGSLTGMPADALTWLGAGLPEGLAALPWRATIADNAAHLGLRLSIVRPAAAPHELVMNCSPIGDGSARARGCLITFSDVTELEQRTRRLRSTLEQLNASQAEIELKNEELTRLATRDSLTGCLNRRSFNAEAEQCLAEARARGTPACVIMCDIDHFKQVNDKFGHAAGDRVIQAAVKSLGRGLRVGDLLGRYGGEEFCILLPGATMAQALEIAERLRADAEAHVGDAVRDPRNVKVTMSFGAAELRAATADLALLVDLADQALYQSKRGGRNRVTSEAALAAAPAEHAGA